MNHQKRKDNAASMGTMHGLNFVLVFKIAQEVLQDVEKKCYVLILLSLAGT